MERLKERIRLQLQTNSLRLNNRQELSMDQFQIKQTPWPLARKQTIPTELPPLVGEI
jgi:hypothetical protein